MTKPISLETESRVIELYKENKTYSKIVKILKSEGKTVSHGTITHIRKRNNLEKRHCGLKANGHTINVPKCIINRLFPIKDGRSKQIRVVIENFLNEYLETLFLYVCEKPDLKVISVSLKPEQYNLLKILKGYRFFPSISEILRFIIMHNFLNKKEQLENIGKSSTPIITENLKVEVEQ